MSEYTHAEHVMVDEAYPMACTEGDCDHYDEHGHPIGDGCPGIAYRVCVDCMDEKGAGRTEESWSDGEWALEPWPHPGCPGWVETPGGMGAVYCECFGGVGRDLCPLHRSADSAHEWCVSCPDCRPGKAIAEPCGKVHDCVECAAQRSAAL